MDGDLVGPELSRPNRTTNAVEDMVAVGLYDHLHPNSGDICQKLPHECLPSGMQMDLWVLNENNVPLGCRKRRHYYG